MKVLSKQQSRHLHRDSIKIQDPVTANSLGLQLLLTKIAYQEGIGLSACVYITTYQENLRTLLKYICSGPGDGGGGSLPYSELSFILEEPFLNICPNRITLRAFLNHM